MKKKLKLLDPLQLKVFKNIKEVAVSFSINHEMIHKEYKLLQRSYLHENQEDISAFWKYGFLFLSSGIIGVPFKPKLLWLQKLACTSVLPDVTQLGHMWYISRTVAQ